MRSDRADYSAARSLLTRAAGEAGGARTEVYALSMLGRVHLPTGDWAAAAARLDESVRVAERVDWLAFLPWPQAMRGEVHLRTEALRRLTTRTGIPDVAPGRRSPGGRPQRWTT